MKLTEKMIKYSISKNLSNVSYSDHFYILNIEEFEIITKVINNELNLDYSPIDKLFNKYNYGILDNKSYLIDDDDIDDIVKGVNKFIKCKRVFFN